MLCFTCFVNNYFREKDSYNVFAKYSERSRFSHFSFNYSSFFSVGFYTLKSTIEHLYKLLNYMK